ncbi:hypothetical protein EVB27_085 [Rhizobium phage RHph_TM16]|nr:hypothetical protein EVB27_085 [Rhizobium phage RHph_TM16]
MTHEQFSRRLIMHDPSGKPVEVEEYLIHYVEPITRQQKVTAIYQLAGKPLYSLEGFSPLEPT